MGLPNRNFYQDAMFSIEETKSLLQHAKDHPDDPRALAEAQARATLGLAEGVLAVAQMLSSLRK